MTPETKQDIRTALRTMAANHAATMAVLQQMLNELSAQLDGEQHKSARRSTSSRVLDPKLPAIDSLMLSVVHKGKRCFLGDTIPYHFIVKLIGRPNRYFSYDELFADVWHGIRSETTVRSVVKVLRAKLRKSRLHELAAAIDGTVKRHYGLMLDGTTG